jgi:hypothetical protein
MESGPTSSGRHYKTRYNAAQYQSGAEAGFVIFTRPPPEIAAKT